MAEIASAACRAHLRWSLVSGIGPILFRRILDEYGDAEAALGGSATRLSRIKGISGDRAGAILMDAQKAAVDDEIDACAEHGVRLLCSADPDYPPGLRTIDDPPIVLYVKGDLRPTDAIAVAIVGSRSCTIYGSEQARRFGELLAGAGFTVVSGLARGIDAFAHHGAVDSGGRSIGVLGCGLNQVYPPENEALAAKLLDHGALVSELPIRTPVTAGNFPTRNRIIAGMSLGTLVVEAKARSGALITARLATEYNREVFAVPGRAQDALSIGTNGLIRKGEAKLTACLEDIVEELGDVGQIVAGGGKADAGMSNQRTSLMASTTPDETGRKPLSPVSLNEVERAVYDVIGYEPIPQDTVIVAAQLPAGDVLGAITSLELRRLIRRHPGNFVSRVGAA